MKRLALLALLVAIAPPAGAQSAAPKPGHYCLRTDIGAADDDDGPAAESLQKLDSGALPSRRTQLGLFGVDLDLTQSGGQTFIAFSNFMPDNGQIVKTDAVPASAGFNGALTFSFTDNWKAPGKGSVALEGDGVVLTIARTKPADTFAGQYSDRQFGEFKLKPGTCPAYSSAR